MQPMKRDILITRFMKNSKLFIFSAYSVSTIYY
jgi:hypothetical protein